MSWLDDLLGKASGFIIALQTGTSRPIKQTWNFSGDLSVDYDAGNDRLNIGFGHTIAEAPTAATIPKRDPSGNLKMVAARVEAVTTYGNSEGGNGSVDIDLERGAGTGADAGRAHLYGGFVIHAHQMNDNGQGFYCVIIGESAQTLLDAQIVANTAGPGIPAEQYDAFRMAWNMGVTQQFFGGSCRFDLRNNNFGLLDISGASTNATWIFQNTTEQALVFGQTGLSIHGSPEANQAQALRVGHTAGSPSGNPTNGFYLWTLDDALIKTRKPGGGNVDVECRMHVSDADATVRCASASKIKCQESTTEVLWISDESAVATVQGQGANGTTFSGTTGTTRVQGATGVTFGHGATGLATFTNIGSVSTLTELQGILDFVSSIIRPTASGYINAKSPIHVFSDSAASIDWMRVGTNGIAMMGATEDGNTGGALKVKETAGMTADPTASSGLWPKVNGGWKSRDPRGMQHEMSCQDGASGATAKRILDRMGRLAGTTTNGAVTITLAVSSTDIPTGDYTATFEVDWGMMMTSGADSGLAAGGSLIAQVKRLSGTTTVKTSTGNQVIANKTYNEAATSIDETLAGIQQSSGDIQFTVTKKTTAAASVWARLKNATIVAH